MKRNREIYMYFILRALPIMIIPVLLMTFAYFGNLQVIRHEVYEKNVSIIENNARLVDNTLEATESIANYLNENIAINKFLNYVTLFSDGTNTVAVNTLQRDLKSLVLANDYVTDIHLYAKKNEMLLTHTGAVIDLSRYYGKAFAIEDVSYQEWVDRILMRNEKRSKPDYDTVKLNNGKAALLYNSNLPVQAGINSGGTVSIYLDLYKIMRNFDNIDYQNGYIYIKDSNQSVLYEYNGTDGSIFIPDEKMQENKGFFLQTIEKEKYFVTYYRDSNQWVYVTAIPKALAEGSVGDNIIYLLAMLVFTLMIGILLAHFFSTRLSLPISKGFELLKSESSKMTYNTFNEAVEVMIEKNTQMQEELEKQIPALKTSIFHSLITGGYPMQMEVLESLEKIGVRTNAMQYIVLVISLNDLEVGNDLKRVSMQKIYLKEIIIHTLATNQVYDLDFEQVGVLLEYDCSDVSEAKLLCEERLNELRRGCNENHNISISFHGDVVKNLQNIPLTFRRVMRITGKMEPAQGRVEWYDKNKFEAHESFYYPSEMEERLLTSLSWGNVVETKLVMEKLRTRNQHIMDTGSNKNLLHLLQQMQNSLLRILKEEGSLFENVEQMYEEISQGIAQEKDLLHIFNLQNEFFLYLAEQRKARWQKDNHYMKEKLHNYINENYRDPQLTLSMVAEQFELSEVYLSKLFKQFFGQNFSKYVEKLRLDQAKIRVEEGKYRIEDIALQVGYNSPQSFRRAYKRVFNCTPRDR